MDPNAHLPTTTELISSLDSGELHTINEYCTRAIAAKIINPGDVVLDLGANEGFHTLHFASLVGDTGCIHAFEPNPSHWRNLLGHNNVRLWPMAVGDTISVENFYLPIENNLHQVGSLVNPQDFLGPTAMRVLTVPQVTIDSLDELNDQMISFVKMDIERREYHCILGMSRVLREKRPVLIFENITSQIESALVRFGYSVASMIYGYKVDILPNVLAVPESRITDLPAIALNDREIRELISSVK